jgi:hypothetical protein
MMAAAISMTHAACAHPQRMSTAAEARLCELRLNRLDGFVRVIEFS